MNIELLVVGPGVVDNLIFCLEKKYKYSVIV